VFVINRGRSKGLNGIRLLTILSLIKSKNVINGGQFHINKQMHIIPLWKRGSDGNYLLFHKVMICYCNGCFRFLLCIATCNYCGIMELSSLLKPVANKTSMNNSSIGSVSRGLGSPYCDLSPIFTQYPLSQ